jgi:DNA modification methylase
MEEEKQFTIYNMGVIKALAKLPSDSIDCIITSPPYWGLRDYKVEGQIGLEEHPQLYIDKIVSVFEEVKRVLKPTGTVFLNLGDCYYSHRDWTYSDMKNKLEYAEGQKFNPKIKSNWLQPKQRMLIPHRIAIAMQDKGWVLRNDLVWRKLSHMPSSVKDRLSNSFEYIFFFVKHPKNYFFDLEAIRVPHKTVSLEKGKNSSNFFREESKKTKMANLGFCRENHDMHYDGSGYNPSGKNPSDFFEEDLKDAFKGTPPSNWQRMGENESGKNPSNFFSDEPTDIFESSSEPFFEAHFACFPKSLPRFCLKAGCPREICKKCGKPKKRIEKTTKENIVICNARGELRPPSGEDIHLTKSMGYKEKYNAKHETLGWQPTCSCGKEFEASIVLDPFVGSGTTLQVAQEMGLRGIGIELNEKYLPLINLRLFGDKKQTSLNENKIRIIKE